MASASGSKSNNLILRILDIDANFTSAVQVVGSQIHNEFVVTPFDYHDGFGGGDSILTDLHPSRTIGLDIIASSRYEGGIGMPTE